METSPAEEAAEAALAHYSLAVTDARSCAIVWLRAQERAYQNVEDEDPRVRELGTEVLIRVERRQRQALLAALLRLEKEEEELFR